jgi:hypothetical protein
VKVPYFKIFISPICEIFQFFFFFCIFKKLFSFFYNYFIILFVKRVGILQEYKKISGIFYIFW